MKYLYKYPQAAFPYGDLVETNRRASRRELEYELLDTGVFDDDRYFDVVRRVREGGPRTSSSGSPSTIAGRKRRGCTCCRRSGSGTPGRGACDERKPARPRGPRTGHRGLASTTRQLGIPAALRRRSGAALHRERDQHERSGERPNASPYVKDAFQLRRRAGNDAVNPGARAPRRRRTTRSTCRPAAAGRSALRLTGRRRRQGAFGDFDQVFASAAPTPTSSTSGSRRLADEDQRRVHRQALAGMLWTKQFYYFDLEQWLSEHKSHPLLERRARACGTPSGSTCSTPTSSRCRTSGSTRGTRRGTWRSTPSSRSRWSTSTSRRSSCC